MNMEELLKTSFKVENVYQLEFSASGWINQAQLYQVGDQKMFVKQNDKDGAALMFRGEMHSLNAIKNTNTVSVPSPYLTCENPNGGYMLVMEYLDLKSLATWQSKFGEELASLHLSNILLKKAEVKNENYVGKSDQDSLSIDRFGFDVPTCCGFIPLDNTWSSDWVVFYGRQRLQNTINMIAEKTPDRELLELWSELQLIFHKLFENITIFPSLLHGDLWSGNAGELTDRPVMFDPCAFYGHHEFELSISKLFGGFHSTFYSSYHSVIPKESGFDGRQQLYTLFHLLNHLNHFGNDYLTPSISMMRSILKTIKNL